MSPLKTRRFTHEGISQVSQILTSGGIVALPTETVYGLAGNAFSRDSVLKIFKAKDRPDFDPLITHVSSQGMNSPDGILNELVRQGVIAAETRRWKSAAWVEKLMMTFWPGPLTLILPRGPKIPDEVTSGSSRVGVRMPSHPLFQAVLGLTGFPLAAPSANRFGRISPTTADHVMAELDGRIDAILDGGPCAVGVESTILALDESGEGHFSASLLRPGKIPRSDLETLLEIPVVESIGLGEKNRRIEAPGMLDQHYAPKKPLFLLEGPFRSKAEAETLIRGTGLSGRPVFLCQGPDSARLFTEQDSIRILAPEGGVEAAARQLFSTLRDLDEDDSFDLIVAELPENTQQGLAAAIADRLNRASVNKPLLKR